MGNLYISGAQCVHAKFKDGNHWKFFDEQEEALRGLAKKFDVTVARESMDDHGAEYFVVKHNEQRFGEFYSGEAFERDMTIQTSETFAERATSFVEALNKEDSLSDFHNLQWSTNPKVLYFVSS